MLDERLRRRLLNDRARQAFGKAHPHFLGVKHLAISARLAEQLDGFGIFADLDADFLQDRVGIGLDDGEALVAEDVVGLDLALDVGELNVALTAAQQPPGLGTAARATLAASASFGFVSQGGSPSFGTGAASAITR